MIAPPTSRGRRARAAPYDQINITPMVDLTFVLLIIFIIMTTAAVQGVQISLPRASEQSTLTASKTKAITVRADGSLYLDTYPVSRDELQHRLATLRARDPLLPVVIRGDAAVPYQHIVEVLDLCGRLGITQIGLVTQPARS